MSSRIRSRYSRRQELILSYFLLTPWSRVLLEKLTGFQLVKKLPTFYGTRRFITAFTNARHLSLSLTSSIQSTFLNPNSWRSILILSFHLCLGRALCSREEWWDTIIIIIIYAWVSQVGSFPQVSPPKPCIGLFSPPYALHAPPISFFSILSPEQ
jgi:hypothetical protein